MFNNSDPTTNGELDFYQKIKPTMRVIFDVGCRNDSLFLDFPGEVHYFDPVQEFIDKLQVKPCNNFVAVFNSVGLSNKTGEISYYPGWQSFHPRMVSCEGRPIYRYDGKSTLQVDKLTLRVQTGSEYMDKMCVRQVDFLKIDTEGSEYDVLEGFGDNLDRVCIVQFEYGQCYLDSGAKLNKVIHLLQKHGFTQFGYLCEDGSLFPIDIAGDLSDHYQFCNIVASKQPL